MLALYNTDAAAATAWRGHNGALTTMGAGTEGAGWASAHPLKNQGGHGPPWKF